MAVVEVKNGFKYYGSKSNPTIVLNSLDMTVQPGTIYALLGASGCGKTTLLSCIVGQRRLNNGAVNVLGSQPGDRSIIPKIGYMPQQLALVPEMSVKQCVFYFGRLYGMSTQRMEEKYGTLKNLLQLPPSKQMIKQCSGGQQRRVSFACALIHDPQLLILDEPTVGLDPILRNKIWDFLLDMTRLSNTAVIITTHYIEEARQANCVGIMRQGILLTEDSPQNIILRHGVNSLEDAILRLSQLQSSTRNTQNQKQTQLNDHISGIKVHSVAFSHSLPYNNKNAQIATQATSSFTILKALFTKNLIKMERNIVMLCFILVMPLMCDICFITSIGKTIKGLKLGVVNMESTCENPNMTSVYTQDDICYMNNISCSFIRALNNTDLVKPIVYEDFATAHRDAKRTEIIGYIHIPSNFSTAMQKRLEEGRFTDNETLHQTFMETRLDMTAGQSAYFIEKELIEHFQNFIGDIMSECNEPRHIAAMPVTFKEPIYGSEEVDSQQFMAPAFFLTVVFFLNTLVTANIFIEERMDGFWDRTIIAGATANQFLWSHLIIQFLLSSILNAEFLVFISWIFGSKYHGSQIAVAGLMTLSSTSGIFFGLLLSIYCKTHTDSNYVVTGTFFPMVAACGLIWPLEGMPSLMHKIIDFTPFALPSVSARNIIVKGWELTHKGVYKGYMVLIVWVILLYVLCIIGIKRKM